MPHLRAQGAFFFFRRLIFAALPLLRFSLPCLRSRHDAADAAMMPPCHAIDYLILFTDYALISLRYADALRYF